MAKGKDDQLQLIEVDGAEFRGLKTAIGTYESHLEEQGTQISELHDTEKELKNKVFVAAGKAGLQGQR